MKANRNSQKLSPLCKMAKYLSNMSKSGEINRERERERERETERERERERDRDEAVQLRLEKK